MSDILFKDGQIVFSSGSIVFTAAPEDCECCGEPECTTCAGPAGTSYPRRECTHTTVGEGGDYKVIGKNKCNRLLVYEGIQHNGSAFTSIPTPTILKTNAVANPGTGNPFETSVGSGIYLNSAPYWWPMCDKETLGDNLGIGGYAVGTLECLPDMNNYYADAVSAGILPGTGVPFTLLVLVRGWHKYWNKAESLFSAADGVTDVWKMWAACY